MFYNKKEFISFVEKGKGAEAYHKIAKTGAKDEVYVWFEGEEGVERMWVKITKGNKKKGQGVLINQPIRLTDLAFGYFLHFKQCPNSKIVIATNIFEGSFCTCCGDPMDDVSVEIRREGIKAIAEREAQVTNRRTH